MATHDGNGWGLNGPRQQSLDAVDWMLGDLSEDIPQIALGVDVVEPGGAERVDRRGRSTAAFVSGLMSGSLLIACRFISCS